MIKFVDDAFLTEVWKLINAKDVTVFKNSRPMGVDNPCTVIRFRNSMYDFPIQDGYLQVLMYRDLFSNKSIDSAGHESMKDVIMDALKNGVTVSGGAVYYFEPLSSGAPLIDKERPDESYKEVRFRVRLVETGQ